MIELTPDVESNVPLPTSAVEAMPELTPHEELNMRGRTIKLISDLTGIPIEPNQTDRNEALKLAHTMMANPAQSPQLAQYGNETLAYLAGMVAQHDTLVVKDLADLKKYVVNKLVAESESSDPKIRLIALRALGEVDGVDAFKKRTEMTVKQQSIEEVEKELLLTLEKLGRRTVNVKAVEIQDVEAKNEESVEEIEEIDESDA